eukprot:scaffold18861_cov26-Tisochrysis_lutea.AAC.3
MGSLGACGQVGIKNKGDADSRTPACSTRAYGRSKPQSCSLSSLAFSRRSPSRSTEIASSRNSVVLPSMANARLKRERRSTRKSSASATDLAVLWVAPAEILAYSPSFEVPSDGGGSASIVSLLCRSSSAAVAAASIALRGNGSTNERELAAALAAASRRFRSATTCASAPATSTASSSARPCWEGTVPATCASSSVTHNPADKRRRRAPAAVLSSENELRRRERDGVGAETPGVRTMGSGGGE